MNVHSKRRLLRLIDLHRLTKLQGLQIIVKLNLGQLLLGDLENMADFLRGFFRLTAFLAATLLFSKVFDHILQVVADTSPYCEAFSVLDPVSFKQLLPLELRQLQA